MANDPNTGTTLPPAFSEAMGRILEHPEWISAVASALRTPDLTTSAETETLLPTEPSADENDEGENSSGSSPPLDEAVRTESHAPSFPQELPALLHTLAPLLSVKNGGEPKGKGHREEPSANLLRALKPYVSRGRQEAIDYMIRISEISDLIKRL